MMRGFRVPFDGRVLIGDVLAGEEPPRLLVLHGAGQSNRERFRQIREHFLASGIGSVAFDCIGHGETGGDLKQSSLQSRTAQACAVIEALSLSQPFSVLAGSMGGYTAVTLLRRYAIANLILVVPAMYTAEAYDVPFNAGFTGIIRRPKSWESSDGWELLSRFTGRLLLVAGERDRVIPSGVIQGIYEAAKHAKERTLFVAPGASHMVLTDLRAHAPDQLDRVLGLMIGMLTADKESSGSMASGAVLEEEMYGVSERLYGNHEHTEPTG
ncbi:MAG: alpha/beta fold hydrolase [candidate division NC10 bacterium]|nr:alpha/beta fold hydrolase [candidate division NC10 bacterium]